MSESEARSTDPSAGGPQPDGLPATKRNAIIVAIIGAVGVIVAAVVTGIFGLLGTSTQGDVTSAPTRRECADNVIACSQAGGIGNSTVETLEPDSLEVVLNPQSTESESEPSGHGVFLKFDPALNVEQYDSMEIVSTSTRAFSFVIEYKVRTASNDVQIVKTAGPHNFPVAKIRQQVDLPIRYEGAVDEIVINVPEPNAPSELLISAIRLRLEGSR